MDCITEGPEVVCHGEDLEISPWAIVSKALKDFKQYKWGFTVLKCKFWVILFDVLKIDYRGVKGKAEVKNPK